MSTCDFFGVCLKSLVPNGLEDSHDRCTHNATSSFLALEPEFKHLECNLLPAGKTSTLDDGEVADVDVNISPKTLIEED